MEKYKSIYHDIEEITNKEVVKQTRISLVAAVSLLAAIAAFVGAKAFEDPNSALPTFLFTASAFLLLVGIIKLFTGRNCYLFRPTKSLLKPVTLYFDVHESDALQACMEMKRFDDLHQLKRLKDTGVKLEVMVAHDGKFAAVQLSEYVPYAYEAITPVMCYYGDEARALAAYVKA